MKEEDMAWLTAEIRRRGPDVERDPERIERAVLAIADLTPFAAQHGVDPEAIADALALIFTTKAEFVPGPRPRGDA